MKERFQNGGLEAGQRRTTREGLRDSGCESAAMNAREGASCGDRDWSFCKMGTIDRGISVGRLLMLRNMKAAAEYLSLENSAANSRAMYQSSPLVA